RPAPRVAPASSGPAGRPRGRSPGSGRDRSARRVRVLNQHDVLLDWDAALAVAGPSQRHVTGLAAPRSPSATSATLVVRRSSGRGSRAFAVVVVDRRAFNGREPLVNGSRS